MSSSPLSRLTPSTRPTGTARTKDARPSLRPSERVPPPRSQRTSSPAHSRRPSQRVSAERSALPPTPDVPFELLTSSPTETVAIAGDCLIVLIGHTLSANGVLAIQRGFERLERAYGRFGYLSRIEAQRLGGMEPRARALMADLIGKYTRNIAAASFAVEGVGFRATAVRSILTAIHVASRASHPLKVFSSLDAALAWYAEKHPDHRCSPATLARVVAALAAQPG